MGQGIQKNCYLFDRDGSMLEMQSTLSEQSRAKLLKHGQLLVYIFHLRQRKKKTEEKEWMPIQSCAEFPIPGGRIRSYFREPLITMGESRTQETHLLGQTLGTADSGS